MLFLEPLIGLMSRAALAPVLIVGLIGRIKPADFLDIPREFSALLAAQCENAHLPMDHACPSPGAASAA